MDTIYFGNIVRRRRVEINPEGNSSYLKLHSILFELKSGFSLQSYPVQTPLNRISE